MEEPNKINPEDELLQKKAAEFVEERRKEIGELLSHFRKLGPTYAPIYTKNGSLVLNTIDKPDLEAEIVDQFIRIMGSGNPCVPDVERRVKNSKYILDAIKTVVEHEFYRVRGHPEQLAAGLQNIFGADALEDKKSDLEKVSLCEHLASLYETFEKENSTACQVWLNSAALFFPIVEYACSRYIKDFLSLPGRINKRTQLSRKPLEMFMDEADELKEKYLLGFQTILAKELFKDISGSPKIN